MKSELAREFDAEGIEFFIRRGLNKALQLTGMGSDIGLVKCWWNNRLIDCERSFLDHVTDYGLCFTFNPSVRYVSNNVSVGTVTEKCD